MCSLWFFTFTLFFLVLRMLAWYRNQCVYGGAGLSLSHFCTAVAWRQYSKGKPMRVDNKGNPLTQY